MYDNLTENGDAALQTVDARLFTDRQTHRQTHRHNRFYDSCPSLMGNYNNGIQVTTAVGIGRVCPYLHARHVRHRKGQHKKIQTLQMFDFIVSFERTQEEKKNTFYLKSLPQTVPE